MALGLATAPAVRARVANLLAADPARSPIIRHRGSPTVVPSGEEKLLGRALQRVDQPCPAEALARFPQLTEGRDAPLEAVADDAPWDGLPAIPLRDFFASDWFRRESAAFDARYDELRRRWEADR